MGTRIHDRIRELIETTPGLTQRGLAERMGLNPAAVNRMLYGRRNIMAEEVPIIEGYLGVRLDLSAPAHMEYLQEKERPALRGFSDGAQAQDVFRSEAPAPSSMLVPVYGARRGGPMAGGEAVDWVQRHPAQAGIRDAFAVYVPSDEMEPRYFRGELVYVHPGRPAEPGKDCLIEMDSGDLAVRRLVRQTDKKLRVLQFNPPQEKDLPLGSIRALLAVVGRG